MITKKEVNNQLGHIFLAVENNSFCSNNSKDYHVATDCLRNFCFCFAPRKEDLRKPRIFTAKIST